MSQLALLVLAAGMGSRFGGLKQIDPVGPYGETIIDYSIYDAARSGFGEVVFVIRHDIEKDFKEAVGNKYADKMDVEYLFQELDMLPHGYEVPVNRQKPWGSGHAILMAKRMIEGPFGVINSDDFYGRSAFAELAAFLSHTKDDHELPYGMVGYQLANTLSQNGGVSRGVCHSDSDGFLFNVAEVHDIQESDERIVCSDKNGKPILSGDETVSMNMWGFMPSVFDYLESHFVDFLRERGTELQSEYYIPFVISTLINAEQAAVKVLSCDAQWFGVTYKEDKSSVQDNILRLVNAGFYPAPLWS